MAYVYRRTRVSRTTFRTLPNGGIYYSGAGTSGPFVKTGRRRILAANSDPQQSPLQTAIADTSIRIVKVDKFPMRSQRSV